VLALVLVAAIAGPWRALGAVTAPLVFVRYDTQRQGFLGSLLAPVGYWRARGSAVAGFGPCFSATRATAEFTPTAVVDPVVKGSEDAKNSSTTQALLGATAPVPPASEVLLVEGRAARLQPVLLYLLRPLLLAVAASVPADAPPASSRCDTRMGLMIVVSVVCAVYILVRTPYRWMPANALQLVPHLAVCLVAVSRLQWAAEYTQIQDAAGLATLVAACIVGMGKVAAIPLLLCERRWRRAVEHRLGGTALLAGVPTINAPADPGPFIIDPADPRLRGATVIASPAVHSASMLSSSLPNASGTSTALRPQYSQLQQPSTNPLLFRQQPQPQLPREQSRHGSGDPAL
jgi:hypothetical protein